MPPIVHATALARTYQLGGRCVAALRGIDLIIDTPGFYAIMGPSGSGKSTLLHLLAALDRPDDGTIEIGGRSLDALNERELTLFRRRHIGIVFQQFNLIPTLTAIENVALPALLDGVPARDRMLRSRELLATLGLADRESHRPEALSGGEQQRVAIARALYFEPEILLADEPTGNLDSSSSHEIWKLLRSLSDERSVTVIMVTHEPAAAAHCQKVFLLRDGLIADTFDVDGLDAAELATRAQHTGR